MLQMEKQDKFILLLTRIFTWSLCICVLTGCCYFRYPKLRHYRPHVICPEVEEEIPITPISPDKTPKEVPKLLPAEPSTVPKVRLSRIPYKEREYGPVAPYLELCLEGEKDCKPESKIDWGSITPWLYKEESE